MEIENEYNKVLEHEVRGWIGDQHNLLYNKDIICPKCAVVIPCVSRLVTHLNDGHEMSFCEIADILNKYKLDIPLSRKILLSNIVKNRSFVEQVS